MCWQVRCWDIITTWKTCMFHAVADQFQCWRGACKIHSCLVCCVTNRGRCGMTCHSALTYLNPYSEYSSISFYCRSSVLYWLYVRVTDVWYWDGSLSRCICLSVSLSLSPSVWVPLLIGQSLGPRAYTTGYKPWRPQRWKCEKLNAYF